MISEILIDAIGDIGDEYIDEYARLRTAYKDKRSNLKRIWIAASAACICLAVLATAYVIKSSNNPDVELALKNTESPDYVVKVTKEPEVIVDTKLPTAEPTDVPVIEPTEIIMETENPIMIVTSEPEETTEQVTEAPTEKDWQSEWTYFIAHLDSEQGKGVTAHPDDKIYKTFSADISPNYTDEEFKSNSIWLFEVNYNGSLYRACKSQITKADIGAYLQNIDLCIYERRLINYNFKETVSLFTINNISPDAALAISIGQDEYYILVNTNYKPSSFIQSINDFNLKQTTDLNEIAYFDKSGNVISIDVISEVNYVWEILSENASSIVETDVSNYISAINITINSDFFSFYNISFSIYEEGYVYFNVLGKRMCFVVKDFNNVINQLK